MFIEIDTKFNIYRNLSLTPFIKDNKIILPKNIAKFEKRKQEKILYKMRSLIKSSNIQNVIYEKSFKKINITNCSKVRLEQYILEITQHIIKSKKLDKETRIAIVVNKFNELIKKKVCDLVNKYKHVSIVTCNMASGIKLQNEIFDAYGIMLKVSNNKRKALKDAELILNIDLDSKNFNKYIILDKAIIININNEVEINSMRFSGLNLNKIVFKISDKSKEYIEKKYGLQCDKYDVEDFTILEDKINIEIDRILSKNGYL